MDTPWASLFSLVKSGSWTDDFSVPSSAPILWWWFWGSLPSGAREGKNWDSVLEAKDRMTPSWNWSSLSWQLGLSLSLWLIPALTWASASLPFGLAKEICWNRSQSARTRWWGPKNSLTWGATSCSEIWPWMASFGSGICQHHPPGALSSPKERFHRWLPTEQAGYSAPCLPLFLLILLPRGD